MNKEDGYLSTFEVYQGKSGECDLYEQVFGIQTATFVNMLQSTS